MSSIRWHLLVQPIKLINQNTHSSSPWGSEVSKDSHQPNKHVSHPGRTNTATPTSTLVDPYFSASLLITILLAHVNMPAEPYLSAPCLFPGKGNVTQRLLTSVPHFQLGGPNCLTLRVIAWPDKGLWYLSSPVQSFQVIPEHEYISTLYIHTSGSFASACISRQHNEMEMNNVNSQAFPELQADLHPPVKKDNNLVRTPILHSVTSWLKPWWSVILFVIKTKGQVI